MLISPEDLLRQLGSALEHVPGLAYVIVIGNAGDTANLRAARNVSPGIASQMLKNAADKLGMGDRRIVTPT